MYKDCVLGKEKVEEEKEEKEEVEEEQAVVVLCHSQETALGNLGSLGWVRGWHTCLEQIRVNASQPDGSNACSLSLFA